MIYKHLKCRSTIRLTLEYILRENKEHGHKMQHLIFLHGSSISPSPLSHDKDGRVICVDVDDLVNEFEFQSCLYNGASKCGQVYDHSILSLAPEDKPLSPQQWGRAARILQRALGFEFKDTLWAGGIHLENQAVHLHLASCRVTNDGKLVSMHDNYVRAQKACRAIEKEFGLKVVPSSDEELGEEDMNRHVHAKEILRDKSREINDMGVRKKIRRIIGQTFKCDEPKNIKQFVEALGRKGVDVRAREGSVGEVMGVSYRIKSLKDRWYSGSNVSSLHATWGSLLRKDRKDLDYSAERDNPSIGLAPVFKIRVKVTKSKLARIRRLRINAIVREINREPWIDFTFCRSAHDANIAKIIAAIMDILSMLFGKKRALYEEAVQQMQYAEQVKVIDADYLAKSKTIHESEITAVYNVDDIQKCAQAIDRDTQVWRREIGPDGMEGLHPNHEYSYESRGII